MACALLNVMPAGAQTTTTTQTLFNNSDGKARIPAITKLANGNLMAFSDYRIGGGDIGSGVVNVVARTSTESTGTSSWNSKTTVVAGSSSGSGISYANGDAAVVTDRETGKILMMTASGSISISNSKVVPNGTYHSSIFGSYYTNTTGWNDDDAMRIGRHISADDGGNWTSTDVTTDVYNLLRSYSNSWTGITSYSTPSGMFFSSGRICQSKVIKNGDYYRLYASLVVFPVSSYGSIVVYSDDFGETWNVLGGSSARPYTSGDEAKVEELPNGNVLLSCKRNSGTGRYFNIYKYTNQSTAAGSWGTATKASDIASTDCNGEILIVPAKCVDASSTNNGHYAYVALQSVPANDGGTGKTYRNNVSIYYKVLSAATDFDEVSDFTSGWTQYKVSTTESAYSTMVLDDEGNVAFLYEEDVNGSFYNIKFMSLPLTTITNDTYTTYLDLDYDEFLAADNEWVGKVVTMKVGVTKDNVTKYYYIKDTYDEENCTPMMEVVKGSELPTTLDKSYYWVISKDPGADYYYLSSLNGDGYLGKGDATNHSQDDKPTTNNGITCTDDKDNIYEILDFSKEEAASSSSHSAEELNGYAIKFAFTDSKGNSTFRFVALGVDEDDSETTYELNWLDYTSKGTTEVASTSGKCYSTDFIFEEVDFKEPNTDGSENFGTVADGNTHSGFPVKFTRSSDDYEPKTIDGVTEDFNRYATLNLPYAVELPAGVTAYKVSNLKPEENTNVVLEKYLESVEGDLKVLPRETPVLLCMAGEKNDGKVQTTEYLHPALAQTIVETGLNGSLGKKKLQSEDNTASNYYNTGDKTYYVLSKKNGRVAFYWLSKLELAANKAYYVATSSSVDGGVIGFSFGGNGSTSGIILPAVNAAADNANAPIYDLQGRRVSRPSKGIYIKAGKKFIVK